MSQILLEQPQQFKPAKQSFHLPPLKANCNQQSISGLPVSRKSSESTLSRTSSIDSMVSPMCSPRIQHLKGIPKQQSRRSIDGSFSPTGLRDPRAPIRRLPSLMVLKTPGDSVFDLPTQKQLAQTERIIADVMSVDPRQAISADNSPLSSKPPLNASSSSEDILRVTARAQNLELTRLRKESIEKEVECARLSKELSDRQRDISRMQEALAQLQQQLSVGETKAVIELRSAMAETERVYESVIQGKDLTIQTLQMEKADLLNEMRRMVMEQPVSVSSPRTQQRKEGSTGSDTKRKQSRKVVRMTTQQY